MTLFTTVFGTHAWDREHPERQWWHPQSLWSRYMHAQGCAHARPDEPFLWSGDLDGTPGAGNDWEITAVWLRRYLRTLAYEDRNLIAHSHGGQPALEAAINGGDSERGVPIRTLIMIGTPVRKHTERVVCPQALPNIARCVQVIDQHRDWTATLGGLFDRQFTFRRDFRVPAVPGVHGGIQVVKLPQIGHSGLLNDPTQFPLWETAGLLAALKSAGVVV